MKLLKEQKFLLVLSQNILMHHTVSLKPAFVICASEYEFLICCNGKSKTNSLHGIVSYSFELAYALR